MIEAKIRNALEQNLLRFVKERGGEIEPLAQSIGAANTKHGTARRAYNKMRGSAKKHVAEAVPKLGALLERHLVTA